MKKIMIVDVRPIVSSLWNAYEGNFQMKQFIKQNATLIMDKVGAIIGTQDDLGYLATLNVNERELAITYEWMEKENIHDWIVQTHKIMVGQVNLLNQANLNAVIMGG